MFDFDFQQGIHIGPALFKDHQLVYGSETEYLPGDEKTAYWVRTDTTLRGIMINIFGYQKTIYFATDGNDIAGDRVHRVGPEDETVEESIEESMEDERQRTLELFIDYLTLGTGSEDDA